MLTKHVISSIDCKKNEQVLCPGCGHLVVKINLVPTPAGNVCPACYEKHQGV